jgi:hypothetical protein
VVAGSCGGSYDRCGDGPEHAEDEDRVAELGGSAGKRVSCRVAEME